MRVADERAECAGFGRTLFLGSLIALTLYGQEEDRKRSREAGFAYHLTKPFEPVRSNASWPGSDL